MSTKFNFLDRRQPSRLSIFVAALREQQPDKSDAWIREQARQMLAARDITHELRAPANSNAFESQTRGRQANG